MSDLKNHYQKILKDLENHFQNKEDKEFVLNKFNELSIMFMDVIDRVTYLTDTRIKEVEQKQQAISNKVDMLKKSVDGIENDIYEDDETYDFEIICPYCNHEFIADISSEENSDIECPECHNVIELDWNEEEGCSGNCSHCSGCEDELQSEENCNCDESENNYNNEDEDM